MWIRTCVARWLLALGLLAVLGAVAAADTGGSMGGGDWGGGGGGGGYSSSSSSSSWSSSDSSSSWSSSDSSYSSGSHGQVSPGVTFALIVIGGVIYLVVLGLKEAANRPGLSMNLGDVVMPATDVTVLRIALDARARKFIQGELARIAKVADTRTAEGRMTMLREVSLLLRRVRDAWVYGGAVNEPMRTLDGSRATFEAHVLEARSKFQHETVRNAQGVVTTAAAPEATPRAHEGEGLILVSIIVAARSELFTVRHIGDGEDLRKALEAATFRTPGDLIAIEIVWQPTDEADRLSSLELEAKYPRPALIPLANALVGKAFCAYCGGPYPAELITCPHCGAPARDRAA